MQCAPYTSTPSKRRRGLQQLQDRASRPPYPPPSQLACPQPLTTQRPRPPPCSPPPQQTTSSARQSAPGDVAQRSGKPPPPFCAGCAPITRAAADARKRTWAQGSRSRLQRERDAPRRRLRRVGHAHHPAACGCRQRGVAWEQRRAVAVRAEAQDHRVQQRIASAVQRQHGGRQRSHAGLVLRRGCLRRARRLADGVDLRGARGGLADPGLWVPNIDVTRANGPANVWRASVAAPGCQGLGAPSGPGAAARPRCCRGGCGQRGELA